MNSYDTNKSVENVAGFLFLSPRDSLADFLDSVQYVAMVSSNLAVGGLNAYTLPELRKIEEKVSAVIAENYPSSSVEEQEAYTERNFSIIDGLYSLIAEAVKKEKLKGRDEFLSPKDNLADYADPTEYVTVVRDNFIEGKINHDHYALPELRKVEKQVSAVIAENYPSSSVEEQEAYTKRNFSLVDGLNSLIVEAQKRKDLEGKEKFLSYYQSTRTKGEIFSDVPLIFGADPELGLKVQESIALLERAEYSSEVLTAAQKRLKQFQSRGLHRERHQLHALYVKFENALHDIKEELADFDAAIDNLNDLLATPDPFDKVNQEERTNFSENDVIIFEESRIEYSEIDVDLSELDELVPAYVAPQNLEAVVTHISPQPKKGISFLAKAAMVVTAFAGIGTAMAGIGYNYLHSPVEKVNSTVEQTSLTVVDTPKTNASQDTKISYEKAAPQQPSYKIPVTGPLEVEARPLQVKPIPKIDPSKTQYTIQSGDTFVKLFKRYQVEGGLLSFDSWLKQVRNANPQIPDLNAIGVKQPVQLPK